MAMGFLQIVSSPHGSGPSAGPVPMPIDRAASALFHHDGVTIAQPTGRLRRYPDVSPGSAVFLEPTMNYAGRSNWGRLRRSVDQVAGTDVSWGQVLYRASVVVALLILALAAGNSLYNVSENRPLVPL